MRLTFYCLLIFLASPVYAQQQTLSIFDGRSWGVVLEHPDMKKVVVRSNVPYLSDSKGTLNLDVYLPPGTKPTDRLPAIIFLNSLGDAPGEMKAKDWGTYRTWPQLIAANKYIGISMECDRDRPIESIKAVFSFIEKEGNNYSIDATRLGVYAASANVTQSVSYLMSAEAYPGIKAAVLYYGRQPQGPFRKDLPVLFVIPEGDVRGGYTTMWNEVLKNNAPWRIQMGTGLIHAFDSFTDNDTSRIIIKETISFWKNHLDVIPPHSWPTSIGRATLAAQYGGEPEKAGSILKTWLMDHPDDARALSQYGGILLQRKQFDEAEQVLRKSVSIDPKNTHTQTDLVVALYAKDRNEEAERRLADLASANRLNRNSYANIGYWLFVLNKHKEGVKYFEKAIETGDPLSYDYYNLGCGYAILGEKDRAFVALEKAVSMGYKSKDQYVNDADLNPLKSDKRYETLLTKLQ
ncbi:MAG TPA: tetratricopeptide repeat protein [Chryseolinea sp.]|nr:tetratricopeptide repeat protein [Chryseolinea sp.]